jgi:hypothetical protein
MGLFVWINFTVHDIFVTNWPYRVPSASMPAKKRLESASRQFIPNFKEEVYSEQIRTY